MVGVKDQGLRVKLGYDIDCEKPNPLRDRFQIVHHLYIWIDSMLFKTKYSMFLLYEEMSLFFTLHLALRVCCSLFHDGYFWVASAFLHLPALRTGRGRCMDQGGKLYLL